MLLTARLIFLIENIKLWTTWHLLSCPMNVSLISIFCIKLQVKIFVRIARLKKFYLCFMGFFEGAVLPVSTRGCTSYLMDPAGAPSWLSQSIREDRKRSPIPMRPLAHKIHPRVIHVQHTTAHAGPGWNGVCRMNQNNKKNPHSFWICFPKRRPGNDRQTSFWCADWTQDFKGRQG